ncbi:MAG: hypothetical protein JXK05_06655 [Campylobacterales bacterium]|nr:hypothetical protein [Campylobacterales bacterium]
MLHVRLFIAWLLLVISLEAASYLSIESQAFNIDGSENAPTCVDFSQSYDQPPIVYAMMDDSGNNNAAIEIVSVTTTRFCAKVMESIFEDGPHINVPAFYVAIPQGTYRLPDGTKVEAGVMQLSGSVNDDNDPANDTWHTLNFAHAYAQPPSVVVQLQTNNNNLPEGHVNSGGRGTTNDAISIPWFTATVDAITASSARIALDKSYIVEAGLSLTQPEIVGYFVIQSNKEIAFDVNDGGTNPVRIQTFLTGNVFGGYDQTCQSIQLNNTLFPQNGYLFIASKAINDSRYGGWFRKCADTNWNIGLNIDSKRERGSGEIFAQGANNRWRQVNNPDYGLRTRNHPPAAGSIVAFSRAFYFTELVNEANLTLDASVHPYTVFKGGAFVIDMNLTNRGPDDANNTAINIDLPADVQFLGIATGAGAWSCAQNGTDLECHYLANGTVLPNGTSTLLSVSLSAPEVTGVYTNYLSAISDALDDDGALGSVNFEVIDLEASIVADYRFDRCAYEGISGEVRDERGNHHATAQGGADSADGAINRAITLEGGRYVELSSGGYIDLRQPYSMTAWVKFPLEGTGHDRYHALGSFEGGGDLLYFDKTASSFGWGVWDGAQSNALAIVEPSAGWHFVAVINDGAQTKLLIDGADQGSVNRAANGDLRWIGTSGDNVGAQTIGAAVDEVKFYAIALPQTVAASIEANERAKKNYDGSARLALGCSSLAEWRFDECAWSGAAGEVIDSAGNRHATAQNGVSTTHEAYRINRAAYFDGVNDTVRQDNLYDLLKATASLSFWIKTTQSGGSSPWTSPGIVGVEQRGGVDDIFWGWIDTAGYIGIAAKNQYNAKSAAPINDNAWHHIVLTRNHSSGEVRVYVDGALSSSVVMPSGEIGTSFNLIGGIVNTYSTASYQGYLDELLIYDRVLSMSEVQTLYVYQNSGKNPDGSQRPAVDCTPVLGNCWSEDFSSPITTAYWQIIKAENFTPQMVDGKLMLTDRKTYIATGMTLSGALPARDNYIVITFEHNAYGSTGGADGMTLALSDAAVAPVAGANGGSLGYVQKSGIPGFAGGWLGFGIDEFGNFSNPNEGRVGGPGRRQDSVAIRGSSASNYAYIAGTSTLSPGIDAVSAPGHFYKLSIDTRNAKIWIKVERDTGLGFATIIDWIDATQIAASPDEFRLSLTGSTGGSINYHTVDNFTLDALFCGTVGLPNPVTNYRFDAWDVDRGLSDRNISTKVVAQPFLVTIAALNESNDGFLEFNGTVCARVVDAARGARSDWVQSLFVEQNSSIATFRVDRALQEARMDLKWQRNANVACSAMVEDNTTLSSDDFAVRPLGFTLQPTGPYYALETFSVTARANDAAGHAASDYNESQNVSFRLDMNETRSDCIAAGESGAIQTIQFQNGAAGPLDANYSGLAYDLALRLHEINGSEFARIDRDDTPDAARLISEDEVRISVAPYEINVTQTDINASTQSDWLYMADLHEMNATLHVSVQANDKAHRALRDFNASCYAQNVEVAFDVDVQNGDAALEMNYGAIEGTLMDALTTLGDIDKRVMIAASQFFDGNASASYALNVDRNFSLPVPPFSVSGLAASIVSANSAKVLNHDAEKDDGVLSFYYGRLKTRDLKATTQAQQRLEIEVYRRDDLGASGWQQNSLDWYRNEAHTGDLFGRIHAHSVEQTMHFTGVDDTQVTLTLPQADAGVIDAHVATTRTEPFSRVVHLSVDPWLWYAPEGFGGAFGYAVGSSCLNHPCFNYSFWRIAAPSQISSGTFSGSDFNTSQRKEELRQGVKVFR